ncbi:MAG TPA: hypothetical protein VM690_00740 [Gaiellaceae bacterium]|nr:hypothetical protein [Gaiellaceae bacterium]
MRRVALAFAVFVSLALAPSAFAWTTLSGGVGNTVIPSMLVTQAGTELVSFETTPGGTIDVSRNRAAPKVVVTGDVAAGRTQLVQQPNGAIQLYFPNANGIARLTSVDDGVTWTGPLQTQSRDVGGVQSAAVAPDGTPYFTQDGTGFVNVFRGLNGETKKNVYTPCCGYDESIAVDSNGLVQIAFFSNASANGAFLYEALDADLSPGAQTPLAPSLQHPPRVPLVTDRQGDTFLAWAPGNPATAFAVVPFRGGAAVGDGVTFHMPFSGGDPHMALSVDPSDRLWAAWSGNGVLHVARSRSRDQHFGAQVTTAIPGTAYQVSAVGLTGTPGTVDVVVNVGASLIEQQLLPGLNVRVYKVGTAHWVQALDDGFGIPNATFKIAGRTFHANAAGKAKVPVGSGKAAAPGYVGASFRVK